MFYTGTHSTRMLERHIKRKHSEFFKQALRRGAKKVTKIDVSQVSMEGFVVLYPTFEQSLLSWAVETYQPLRCCEEQSFRDLCLSLSKKCPIVSRDKLHTMLQCQYVRVQEKVKRIRTNRYFALTTDSWTSLAHHSYTTCTAHFIDKNTWQLHSLVLGIFQKSGTSNAIDTVTYVEKQLSLFDLHYRDMTAVMTDTEATMIAAGRMIVESAE